MTHLAVVEPARLPTTYETAKRALAECDRMDECQEWANKAQALASYAAQAKDDSLRVMADRIKARAVQRLGELIKQVPDASGQKAPTEGAHSRSGRFATARRAGLSEHQTVTALRVAKVPREEFEAAVESARPPTVTALAKRGRLAGRSAPVSKAKPKHPYAAALPVLREAARDLKWLADETSGPFRRPLGTCYRRTASVLARMERAQ